MVFHIIEMIINHCRDSSFEMNNIFIRHLNSQLLSINIDSFNDSLFRT